MESAIWPGVTVKIEPKGITEQQNHPSGPGEVIDGNYGGDAGEQVIQNLPEEGIVQGLGEGSIIMSDDLSALPHNSMISVSSEAELNGIISQLAGEGAVTIRYVSDSDDQGMKQEPSDDPTAIMENDEEQVMAMICPECRELFPLTDIEEHFRGVHPDSVLCQAAVQEISQLDLKPEDGSIPTSCAIVAEELNTEDATAAEVLVETTDLATVTEEIIPPYQDQVRSLSLPGMKSEELNITANRTTIELHPCYHCKMSFASSKTLRNHIEKMHHEKFDSSRAGHLIQGTAFKCHFCDYIGRGRFQLRRHLQQVHDIEVAYRKREVVRRIDPVYGLVECIICKAKLCGLQNARTHIRRNHEGHPLFEDALIKAWPKKTARTVNEGTMPCPECMKPLPITFMRKHLRAIHSDSLTMLDSVKFVRNKLNQLRLSGKIRKKPEKFPCPECGRHLDKFNMQNHVGNKLCRRTQLRKKAAGDPRLEELYLKKKKQDPKVKCPECSQEMRRSSLRGHMFAKHQKVILKPLAPVTCPYEGCGKVFLKTYNMKRHIDITHRSKYITCIIVVFSCNVTTYDVQ